MGFLDWLRGLISPQIEEEAPSFEELEAEAQQELKERYAEIDESSLLGALDDEGEDETQLSEEARLDGSVAEFDVGDADADDLLAEETGGSYYGATEAIEVDLEHADDHLQTAGLHTIEEDESTA